MSNFFGYRVIFVVDYIIDFLVERPEILNFVSKDLSLGLYEEKLNHILDGTETKLYDLFLKGVKDNNLKIEKPEVVLFMIIEFVSATLYSILTKKIDITIEEYKPYLHKVIKDMIK